LKPTDSVRGKFALRADRPYVREAAPPEKPKSIDLKGGQQNPLHMHGTHILPKLGGANRPEPDLREAGGGLMRPRHDSLACGARWGGDKRGADATEAVMQFRGRRPRTRREPNYMAGSGRGPWHLARRKALSVGLSMRTSDRSVPVPDRSALAQLIEPVRSVEGRSLEAPPIPIIDPLLRAAKTTEIPRCSRLFTTHVLCYPFWLSIGGDYWRH
jgi:hypothetical protein